MKIIIIIKVLSSVKILEFVYLSQVSPRKRITLKYCPCKNLSLDTAMEGLLLLGLVACDCIHTDTV